MLQTLSSSGNIVLYDYARDGAPSEHMRAKDEAIGLAGHERIW